MDYLRLADESTNPDIRAAALRIAADSNKYERRQQSRVSPTLITVLATSIVIAAGVACSYTFLHYPEHVAFEINGFIVGFVFIIIAVYALLARHLSQDNFMKIPEWVWNRMGNRTPSATGANADDQSGKTPSQHLESRRFR